MTAMQQRIPWRQTSSNLTKPCEVLPSFSKRRLIKGRQHLVVFIFFFCSSLLLVDQGYLTGETFYLQRFTSTDLKEQCGKKDQVLSELKKAGEQDDNIIVNVAQRNPQGSDHEDEYMKSMIVTSPSENVTIHHEVWDVVSDHRAWLGAIGRRCYPESKNNEVFRKFEVLVREELPEYATELWKYCYLFINGGAYLDHDSPLKEKFYDAFTISRNQEKRGKFGGINYAVLSDAYPGTIHGSIFLLDRPTSKVARGMVRELVQTPVETLRYTPFILPKILYKLIAVDLGLGKEILPLKSGFAQGKGKDGAKWMLLKQNCDIYEHEATQTDSFFSTVEEDDISPFSTFWNKASQNIRMTNECHVACKYLCKIVDPCTESIIMTTKHPVLPHQYFSSPSTELPYLHHMRSRVNREDEMVNEMSKSYRYVATIREEEFTPPEDYQSTPSFYQMIQESGNVPSTRCLTCLSGGSCKKCSSIQGCQNYCGCLVRPEPKFVRKTFIVSPPEIAQNSPRLIPRILHQTLQVKKPGEAGNWNKPGWDNYYYDHASARYFLETHFPSEILEVYDVLVPGIYKEDLLRYCVLFIYGGVYVDMDVKFYSPLESAIPENVGFMTSILDQSCLWNGFIAAAPAHPFLAQAIETLVNNVRNRFTLMDIGDSMCPNVNFKLTTLMQNHYFTGGCMLGGAVNKVLGRHPQEMFMSTEEGYEEDYEKIVLPDSNIPGSTILLSKNWRGEKSEANNNVRGSDIFGIKTVYSGDYSDDISANEDIKIIFAD